jgi:hypothetical protein
VSNSDRIEMMRHHGVTRCPAWCIQPDNEHNTETHQSDLAAHTTTGGQIVYLQVLTSWWSTDEDEVIITTALDEYDQLHLSIDDWRRISALGDRLVEQYDNDGEQWAYDGAQTDEEGG